MFVGSFGGLHIEIMRMENRKKRNSLKDLTISYDHV